MSVAIPTYNSEAFLELAVRSVLAQTLTDLEVIIVDDGSTDGSVALAKRLAAQDSRVRVEELEQNGGPSVARNRALQIARGRWFAVLDSDDAFCADRLARLVAAGDEHGADIVADNLNVFDSANPANAQFFLEPGRCAGWLSLEAYLRRTIMYSVEPNLGYLKPVMRIDSLNKVGVRYDPQLRIAEDDDLIVRLLVQGMGYWLVPRAGYAYRRHAASTSHRLSASNAAQIAKAAEGALSGAAAFPASVRTALARRLAAFRKAAAFARLIEALKGKQWLRAATELITAPGILPLLRMPLGAAIRRRLGTADATGPGKSDPAAAQQLADLLAQQSQPA